MNQESEVGELAKIGIRVLDKSDRRLEGLSFLSELKREPGFMPIEYKNYLFLFLFQKAAADHKVDQLVALLPNMDSTIEMNEHSLEKYGYDLAGFCHDTSDALAEGLGGQRVTLNTGMGSVVGVEHGHSLVKVGLGDELVAAFDPTQPSRGQHDPRDPSTYQLKESVITPLVILGNEVEVGRKLAHFYSDNLNELLQKEHPARKLWNTVKQSFR